MSIRKVLAGMGITAIAVTGLASNAGAGVYEGAIRLVGQTAPSAPGSTVQLAGFCKVAGFTAAKISSAALLPVEAKGVDDGDGGKKFQTTATVRGDVKSGRYPVSFLCGAKRYSFNLTVSAPGRAVPMPGRVTIKPKGAPETGGGPVS